MTLKKTAFIGLSVLTITACNKTYQCKDAQGNKTNDIKAMSLDKANSKCPTGTTASVK